MRGTPRPSPSTRRRSPAAFASSLLLILVGLAARAPVVLGATDMVVSNVQSTFNTPSPAAATPDGNSIRVDATTACPANSVTIVPNPPTDYKYCLCYSTYFNSATDFCAGQAKQSKCTNRVPDPQIVYQGLRAMDGQIVDQSYELTAIMPMVFGRKYTSVTVGTCDSAYINKWEVTSTDTAECQDQWRIGVLFSNLAAKCGFTVSSTTISGQNYQSFVGNIYITYEDTVKSNLMTLREGSVYIPVVINMQSQYNTEMTTAVTVWSNFSLSAYVAGRTLVPGATTSTISLAYSIVYPYMVQSYQTDLVVSGAMAPQVTAKVLQPNASQPSNKPVTDAATCAKETDYSNSGKSCSRTLTILLSHNGACSLAGQVTLKKIAIWCATGIDLIDCPLAAPDEGSSIDVSVSTENFCQATGAANKITDLVDIEFLAPDSDWLQRGTNGDTQQKTWMFTRPLYMRMDFSGKVRIQGVSVDEVATRYWAPDQPTPDYSVKYANDNPSMIAMVPTGMYSGDPKRDNSGVKSVPTGGKLGFDGTDQSFLMVHDIDEYFTGGANPPQDVQYNLGVRAKVTLAYTLSGRRRRGTAHVHWRRAVENPYTGGTSAELPQQTVVPYVASPAAAAVPSPPPSSSSSSSIGIIIGVAVGVVLAVALVLAGVVWHVRRRKAAKRRKEIKRKSTAAAEASTSEDDNVGGVHVEGSAGTPHPLGDKGSKGLRDKTRASSSQTKAVLEQSVTGGAASTASRPTKKDDLSNRKGSLTASSAPRRQLDVECVLVESAALPPQHGNNKKDKGKKKIEPVDV